METLTEVKEVKKAIANQKLGLNKKGLTPQQNRDHKKLKRDIKKLAVQCGLDWGVFKKPFYIEIDGKMIETKDFGLVHSRSNEVLNSVKKGYNVSQNSHVIRLALMGIKGFRNLSVVKAGSLNGGRKVYIQLAIEGDALIGDDTVKRYITILDSNDGTSSLSVGIGDLTMSCDNQFFYFYKQGEAKFRHSANMREKMKEIPQLIQFALLQSMRMTELYKEFESTECSRELAHDMVRTQLGYNLKSNKEDLEELSVRSIKNMNSLYENIYGEMDGDERNGGAAKGENFWGLLSGVTRWTTHDKQAPRRLTPDMTTAEKKANVSGRLESIMLGTNYRTNQKALNFILDKTELVF